MCDVFLSLGNLCCMLLFATLGTCLPVCVVTLKVSECVCVCVCVVACKSMCVCVECSGKFSHIVREWT